MYGPSEHLSAKEDVSGKPDFLYETPFVVVRTYVYIHNRISKPWFSSIEHYYSQLTIQTDVFIILVIDEQGALPQCVRRTV